MLAGANGPAPAPAPLTLTLSTLSSAAVPNPLDVSATTEVVVLANMVTAEEAASQEEMVDILEDTKAECEKHGKVSVCD